MSNWPAQVFPTPPKVTQFASGDLLDAVARVKVRKNSGGSDVGARRRLNLIEGTNVTLTVTDDPTDEEIQIAIAAAVGTHNLLSASHPDTLTDSVVLGDLVAGNATPKWARLAGDTSNARKFLRTLSVAGVAQLPAWDTLQAGDIPSLDASKITSGILAQARGGLGKALDLTGLADTYIIYYDLASDSWKVETLPAAAPHNLLSITHSDTLADSVVAGDIIIGNATPKWARLAKGTDNYLLVIDSTSHLPTWKAPGAATAHDLLDGVTDQDTLAGTVVRGDVIVGNSTPKWARKALGASGTYPRSNGTDLAYSAIPLSDLPAVPTCRAYATAQQTIGAASQTPVNFPAENFDTDTMHDNVTNNSRITIKTAGKYLIAGLAMWNPFVANRIFSRIVLNNTTNLTGAEGSGNNLAFLTQSLSAIYTFAVNDYVELQVYQNSVGNQNTYQDAGIASMLSAAFISN